MAVFKIFENQYIWRFTFDIPCIKCRFITWGIFLLQNCAHACQFFCDFSMFCLFFLGFKYNKNSFCPVSVILTVEWFCGVQYLKFCKIFYIKSILKSFWQFCKMFFPIFELCLYILIYTGGYLSNSMLNQELLFSSFLNFGFYLTKFKNWSLFFDVFFVSVLNLRILACSKNLIISALSSC